MTALLFYLKVGNVLHTCMFIDIHRVLFMCYKYQIPEYFCNPDSDMLCFQWSGVEAHVATIGRVNLAYSSTDVLGSFSIYCHMMQITSSHYPSGILTSMMQIKNTPYFHSWFRSIPYQAKWAVFGFCLPICKTVHCWSYQWWCRECYGTKGVPSVLSIHQRLTSLRRGCTWILLPKLKKTRCVATLPIPVI